MSKTFEALKEQQEKELYEDMEDRMAYMKFCEDNDTSDEYREIQEERDHDMFSRAFESSRDFER